MIRSRRKLEVIRLENRLQKAEDENAILTAELVRNRRAIRFALGDLQPGIQPYGTLADLLPAGDRPSTDAEG